MQFMQAKKYIEAIPRFSPKPSLERIRALWKGLGQPQEKVPVVHVAGTNGKGSTSVMIASILQAAGYKTGLYISPAVLDFRERIQINSKYIPKQDLADLTEKIIPLSRTIGDVNESEFLTAMAFSWFAWKKCDIAVIEVGLGGKWDATNGITTTEVSVITSIGLDHTAILGDTLTAIAEEKCGILKPGRPVVTSPGQAAEAFTVIKNNAKNKKCKLIQIGIDQIQITKMDLKGTNFNLKGQSFYVGLAGRHQVINSCTAISVCHILQNKGWNKITEKAIQLGLEQVHFPARMEVLSMEPIILLDGAHNPQGAKVITKALELLPPKTPVMGVIGVLADKDSSQFLKIISPYLKEILCVTPNNRRALSAEKLAQRAEKERIPAQKADTIEEAWLFSKNWARQKGGAVIWCGSFYLAADVYQYLKTIKGES